MYMFTVSNNCLRADASVNPSQGTEPVQQKNGKSDPL